MTQRIGVEHADKDRKLAFGVQAAKVLGGVGDAHLIGEVTDHAGNDLVANLLLIARFGDKAGGGLVGGVGAVP
ncbi:hypothetical protein D3C86_2032920 [compost metagenome]